MKPGYKTTEFYFTIVAQLVGFAYASGLFSSGGTVDKVLGLATMALSHFGYAVSRGLAKAKAPELEQAK